MAEWLLIALILAAAFGGIAYVIPTKFQRRVSHLRLSARKQGLIISATTLPDLDAPAEDRVTSGGKKRQREQLAVVYELAYLGPLEHVPTWQLVRYKKSQIPIPGWLLKNNELHGVQLSDAIYWGTVASHIGSMPRHCVSVSSHRGGVNWIGHEEQTAVLEDRFLPTLIAELGKLRALNIESTLKNQ